MKNLQITTLLFSLMITSPILFAASTQNSNTSTMSFQEALDIIKNAGYKTLHKIELKHFIYHIEALNMQGKAIKFKLNARTGDLSPAEFIKHHHKAQHRYHKK